MEKYGQMEKEKCWRIENTPNSPELLRHSLPPLLRHCLGAA